MRSACAEPSAGTLREGILGWSAVLTPTLVATWPTIARQRFGESRPIARRHVGHALLGEREIDLRGFEIDAGDLNAYASGKLKYATASLADQYVPRRIEMKIIAPELGDVHEPIDVEPVERHEYAEARHTADRAGEILADFVLHVVALEPLQDVTRRIVGAALGHRAMRAECFPRLRGGRVMLARKHRLDRPMREEIRITADRRREMHVSVVGETEMADVVGPILCLRQRAQKHGLQQREVRTVANSAEQLRVVSGRRLVAAGER